MTHLRVLAWLCQTSNEVTSGNPNWHIDMDTHVSLVSLHAVRALVEEMIADLPSDSLHGIQEKVLRNVLERLPNTP